MRLALCLVVSALGRAQGGKVVVSVDAGGAVRQASAAAKAKNRTKKMQTVLQKRLAQGRAADLALDQALQGKDDEPAAAPKTMAQLREEQLAALASAYRKDPVGTYLKAKARPQVGEDCRRGGLRIAPVSAAVCRDKKCCCEYAYRSAGMTEGLCWDKVRNKNGRGEDVVMFSNYDSYRGTTVHKDHWNYHELYEGQHDDDKQFPIESQSRPDQVSQFSRNPGIPDQSWVDRRTVKRSVGDSDHLCTCA